MVEMASSNDAQATVRSLPEDVQLVLSIGGKRLQQGTYEVSAAAIIDLVLRSRVTSIPPRGPFARSRRLVVADPTPTGAPALDAALAVMVSNARPMGAVRCIRKLWRPVSRSVQEGLLREGVVSRPGKFGSLLHPLTIEDEQQQRASVYRLDSAWLVPDSVTDPRAGAFVDIMRNAAGSFSRRREIEPVIRWEWYPSEVRDTIHEVLEGERYLTSSGAGSGWEG